MNFLRSFIACCIVVGGALMGLICIAFRAYWLALGVFILTGYVLYHFHPCE